jgi:AcrR family transcriptional regulator
MTPTDFQRARSPEHKAQRRDAILAAAQALAVRDGVRAVTLSAIAAEVGIHKSALLRYFETREQILLEVAIGVWQDWSADTRTGLASVAADAVPGVLAGSFAQRPLLCDLLAHVALHLERHVSAEGVRAYKLASVGAVGEVAEALAGPLPDLRPDERQELVSATAMIAGALWQISTPGPALAEVYAADPSLGHFAADFPGRLTRSVTVTLAGLRALSRARAS